ncbi:MAG: polysaccharide deacetylase family protein [Planctomycetes bacterium]|nr:polysaccharide deacetylase family protein [Planctomycetota bacterium]
MPQAEWIITFDDGPLPADITTLDNHPGEQSLDALRRILETLRTHPRGPIPAVFYLRGPAYPWPQRPPLSDTLFETGVRMMLDAGHYVGVHAHRHDPDLWWNWISRGSDIEKDLDTCVDYFAPKVGKPLTVFRPPYGQGGLPAMLWAKRNHIRYHWTDLDPQDYLHHPDAQPAPIFVNDAQGHLEYMLAALPIKMLDDLLVSSPRDVLFHVSVRTADHLRQVLDKICEVSLAFGKQPVFTVPDVYMQPDVA